MKFLSKGEVIRDTLLSRSDFLQLIVVAAVLALGINIAASSIVSGIFTKPSSQALVSLGLVFISGLYLALLVFRRRRSRHEIEAVVPYHRIAQRVLAVPGYELANDLSRVLSAAFVENNALQAAWSEEPLDAPLAAMNKEMTGNGGMAKPLQADSSASTVKSADHQAPSKVSYVAITRVDKPTHDRQPKAAQILREALEFCILEELSTHLSSHFDIYARGTGLIKEYTREDVPALLLQNRILSLLSTPIENRAIFVGSGIAKTPPKGEIVTIWGSDGSVYNRFDLVLPTGTTVTRPSPGKLRLENRRVVVEISARYEGFRTNLPPLFAKAFLRVDDETIQPLQVTIEFSVEIKRWALLRIGGWKYHEWADSFSHRLREFASFSDYLDRIGWSIVLTQLHVARRSPEVKQDNAKGQGPASIGKSDTNKTADQNNT